MLLLSVCNMNITITCSCCLSFGAWNSMLLLVFDWLIKLEHKFCCLFETLWTCPEIHHNSCYVCSCCMLLLSCYVVCHDRILINDYMMMIIVCWSNFTWTLSLPCWLPCPLTFGWENILVMNLFWLHDKHWPAAVSILSFPENLWDMWPAIVCICLNMLSLLMLLPCLICCSGHVQFFEFIVMMNILLC